MLVEPVRYLFDGLVTNYAGTPGLAFDNLALGTEDGQATFYRLRQTEDPMPDWYDQLGSFNREIVLSHRTSIPNIEDYLVEETVECLSFRTLAARHQIGRLDLILIDTEGHDFQVLQNIDLRRVRPKMLIYEQKHLAAEDKAAAIRLLRRHGYVVHPCAENAVALYTPFVDLLGRIVRLRLSTVPT